MVAEKADLHEIIIIDETSNEDAASTTTTTLNLNEITVVDNSNDYAAESTATTTDLTEITIDCAKDLNEIEELHHISSYGAWKREMETYLKSQGLWGVVDGSEAKPHESAYFGYKYHTNWRAKDRKAREAIDSKLSEGFRKQYDLVKHNSAKEAWEKLSVAVSYHNLTESERRENYCLEDDTRNYDVWRVVMEYKLRSEDLWGVIDGSEEPPPYKCSFSGEYRRKDKKARKILDFQCTRYLSYWIKHARSAKIAWHRLSRATILNRAVYNDIAATTIDLNEALTGDINDDDSWKDLDDIILVDISNYNSWIIYMEKYLRSQDLWNVVDGSESSPAKDKKAHEAIKMACGPKLYCLVRPGYHYTFYSATKYDYSGKRAWKELRDAYTVHKASNPGTYPNDKIILTPTNYGSWKEYILSLLRGNDLSGTLWVVDTTHRNSADFEDRRVRAYDTIKSLCGREMVPHIMYTKQPKEAWEQLARAEASSPVEKERYSKMVAAAGAAQLTIEEVKKANDELLTKSNYENFIVYLKQLLISRYLWDIVDGSDQPTVDSLCIWKNKNKAALELIQSSCGQDMLAHAQGTQFAQQAWHKLARGAGVSAEEKDPYTRYQPLYKLLEKDELIQGVAQIFLDAFPEAICDRISDDGLTLLHASIMQGRLVFAKHLIGMLSQEQLEIKTDKGQLAISLAVEYDNMELVKLMVEKNSKLLLLENENGHIPFFTSAINGEQEMMRYLYSKTPMEKIDFNNTLGDKDGANLITAALRVDLYDVALDLLKRFPRLATIEDNNGMTVFHVLAAKPSAFLSGHQLGFYQKRIYESAGVSRNRICGKALTAIVPYMKKLSDEKVKHDQAVQIVKIICPQLSSLDRHHLQCVGAYDAIYSTTVHGIVEFFTMLTNSNPNLIYFKDGNGNGLYQHAVISRQEKIFELISQMGLQKKGTNLFDKDMNNILHCAAFWKPSSLSNVSGAALQMQRELQWFQEVEKMVNLKYRELKNKKGIKPKALFTLQHRNLVKEGEKWIKEASQACMVVSTLIATVMFAAAFTVPGGNDQTTGFPVFLSTGPFLVFIVSDAVSLFASCTSILMFFTLLTARYAENDFLMSLPRKLILGLFFLFVSIAFMMAAFAATLVIVLREKVPWVYAPVICLATIPVVLFGALQFPLFFDIVRSTFGRGIFHKKLPSSFCNNMTTKIWEFCTDKLQDCWELLHGCCKAGVNCCTCTVVICCCICSKKYRDDWLD